LLSPVLIRCNLPYDANQGSPDEAGVIEPVQINIRQMIVLVVDAPGRALRKAGPMVRIRFPPPESLRTIGPSRLVAAQPPRGGKAPSVTTIAIENALLVKRWHSTRWHV
jgi:hypothetical protein